MATSQGKRGGAGSLPKLEEAGRRLPGVHSGSAALQTLHFQTTGLQNYERILSILLSHELIGAGCGCPWTQHTLSPWGVGGTEQEKETVPQRLQALWG